MNCLSEYRKHGSVSSSNSILVVLRKLYGRYQSRHPCSHPGDLLFLNRLEYQQQPACDEVVRTARLLIAFWRRLLHSSVDKRVETTDVLSCLVSTIARRNELNANTTRCDSEISREEKFVHIKPIHFNYHGILFFLPF